MLELRMKRRGRGAIISPSSKISQERGATAVEYALMVGLIGIAIIGSVTFLQEQVGTTFRSAGTEIECASDNYRAEYFDNETLSGFPSIVRCEATPNFGANIQANKPHEYSIRWRSKPYMAAGTRTVNTMSDDGIRVKVNGVVVLENWTIHPCIPNSATFQIANAGRQDVEIEYFEHLGTQCVQVAFS